MISFLLPGTGGGLVAKPCPTLCNAMDCSLPEQTPLSMIFSRQEHWSGLPFPPPGDLPNPGIKSGSPALAGGFFTAEPTWEAYSKNSSQILWVKLLSNPSRPTLSIHSLFSHSVLWVKGPRNESMLDKNYSIPWWTSKDRKNYFKAPKASHPLTTFSQLSPSELTSAGVRDLNQGIVEGIHGKREPALSRGWKTGSILQVLTEI